MLAKIWLLFGWFYFGSVSLALVYLFLPVQLGQKLLRLALLVVIFVFAIPQISQAYTQEYDFYQEYKQLLNDSNEQKISYKAGDFYKTYYTEWRKHLNFPEQVALVNKSTKEFHYARMYLYPQAVIEYKTDQPLEPGLYLADMDLAPTFGDAEQIASESGKILFKVGKETN